MAAKLNGTEVRKKLTAPKKATVWYDKDGLSTGSTLLNLATSGRASWGLYAGQYYLFVGDSNSGKAQPLTSKVLTPSGWRRMGDLSVGDEVIDPDGGCGNVLGVFPQGAIDVCRMHFSDGSSAECSLDHLWYVETPRQRGRKDGSGKVLTAEQISRWLVEHPATKLHLPDVKPVEFAPSKDLPIHPYLMGALLGNGLFHTTRVGISTAEPQIQRSVSSVLPRGHRLSHLVRGDYNIRGEKIAGKRRSNCILDATRKMGLAGCRAHNKFIPKRYLFASIADRIDLLHGMLRAGSVLCRIVRHRRSWLGVWCFLSDRWGAERLYR
jgi:ATP-dependent DNA helicase RecG